MAANVPDLGIQSGKEVAVVSDTRRGPLDLPGFAAKKAGFAIDSSGWAVVLRDQERQRDAAPCDAPKRGAPVPACYHRRNTHPVIMLPHEKNKTNRHVGGNAGHSGPPPAAHCVS
jgi:hypothetical protein